MKAIYVNNAEHSDRPTLIVGIDPDANVGNSMVTVAFDGFNPPDNLRIIVRDWSAGSVPDANGDIYEDHEL